MNNGRRTVLMFSQQIVVNPQTQFVVFSWLLDRAFGSRLALLNVLVRHGVRLGKQRF